MGVLATIAYAGNLTSDETDKDLACQWGTSIATLGQFAVLFGIVMLLTWGLDRREILALRRPPSWWQAAGISLSSSSASSSCPASLLGSATQARSKG